VRAGAAKYLKITFVKKEKKQRKNNDQPSNYSSLKELSKWSTLLFPPESCRVHAMQAKRLKRLKRNKKYFSLQRENFFIDKKQMK